MAGNLATTNVPLGIMAAVSVLEALLILASGLAAFMIYKRVMDLVTRLEERHVAPATGRVNAILDDLKDVTARVREETDRVDHAIRATMDRVDDTADRVRSNLRAQASRVIGVVRGLRLVIESVLQSGSRHQPPADAAGRAM